MIRQLISRLRAANPNVALKAADEAADYLEKCEAALGWVYSHERKGTYSMVVAELCDEHFDRSGALLGRVRDAAKNVLPKSGVLK